MLDSTARRDAVHAGVPDAGLVVTAATNASDRCGTVNACCILDCLVVSQHWTKGGHKTACNKALADQAEPTPPSQANLFGASQQHSNLPRCYLGASNRKFSRPFCSQDC